MIEGRYRRVDGHPATVEVVALPGESVLQVQGNAILHRHPEPPQTGELDFAARLEGDVLAFRVPDYEVVLTFGPGQVEIRESGTNPSAGEGVGFAGLYRKPGVVIVA